MPKTRIMFVPDPDPLEIEVLVLPDATLILVAAVIEPLRAANRVLGREQFRGTLTTPDGTPAPLVVVGSYDIARHVTAGLIRRLGRAGLLTGRRADPRPDAGADPGAARLPPVAGGGEAVHL